MIYALRSKSTGLYYSSQQPVADVWKASRYHYDIDKMHQHLAWLNIYHVSYNSSRRSDDDIEQLIDYVVVTLDIVATEVSPETKQADATAG